MNALFTACFLSIQAAPSQPFVFRLQRYKIFLISTVFFCTFLLFYSLFFDFASYIIIRYMERQAGRRVDVSVNVRDHVRDDVRDESLETPLNKGFLLKNVRDERFSDVSSNGLYRLCN